MAAERIIGIDFGTSTSVIRVKSYENGESRGERLEIKEVLFGGKGGTVPTLIQKKEEEENCYFGYDAQRKRTGYVTHQNFKMDLESLDEEKRALARQLTEQFFSYMAKEYRDQSEGSHLGATGEQEQTIVSYPVKWSEETKQFMLDTAKKAGFVNVTGMDEAQAAIQAVVVMSTPQLKKMGLLQDGVGVNVLLIDMGAGTTDLVLSRYVPGETPKTEVINTWPRGGEVLFGGREVDTLLQSFFAKMTDEATAKKMFERVGADKFKSWKEMTVSPSLKKGDVVCDFEEVDNYCNDHAEVGIIDYCLNRDGFEECLKDYLMQFPVLVNGCLANAGMSGSDVDLVIVTGGHSQWYFVEDILAGKMPQFGNPGLTKIEENPERIVSISRPQETVALGLAYSGLKADILQTEQAMTGNTVNQGAEQKEEFSLETEEEMSFDLDLPTAVMDFITKYDRKIINDISNGINHLDKLKMHIAVPAGEPVLMAIDTSWSGQSGKTGSILTTKAIYSRFDFAASFAITWEEFVLGELSYNNSSSIVSLKSNAANAPKMITQSFNKTYYPFLEELQQYLRTNCNEAVRMESVTANNSEKKVQEAGVQASTKAQDEARAFVDKFMDEMQLQAKAESVSEPVVSSQPTFNLRDSVNAGIQKVKDYKGQKTLEAWGRVNFSAIPETPESEFEIGNLGNNTCFIKKYNGSRKEVRIPKTVRGMTVVEIGQKAFSGNINFQANKAVETLVIPDTVKKIGDWAFWQCSNLKWVKLHRNITHIGRDAFHFCDALRVLDFGAEGTVVSNVPAIVPGILCIPPEVKEVGYAAFHNSWAKCNFNEVYMSKKTVVKNTLVGKTFSAENVFYYD